MGLFSSKRKTYVGTTVMRVLEDNVIPDSIKTGSVKAMFAKGEFSDFILEELVQGIGVKADRMYSKAKRSYSPGLP